MSGVTVSGQREEAFFSLELLMKAFMTIGLVM